MAFLKLLRSELKPHARAKKIMETRRQLESWVSTYGNISTHGYEKQIREQEGELASKGEATSLYVYGIPRSGLPAGERKLPTKWIINDSALPEKELIPTRLKVGQAVQGKTGFDLARYAIWIYQKKVYLANDPDLTPKDVYALLNQEKNKRRLALEKAHALQAMTEQIDKPRQRERIPQQVRIEIWQRDLGRCVECESQADLEFDHIIPFAMGGSNSARNLQLLCGDCNRSKGMSLG